MEVPPASKLVPPQPSVGPGSAPAAAAAPPAPAGQAAPPTASVRDSMQVAPPAAAPGAVATAPGASPAAPGTAAPARAAEEGNLFNKVLDTLGAAFKNLWVHAGLSIGAALPFPVISQIASACGLIVSLGAFLRSVIKGEPDWMSLGAGLLYGAGVFVPGLGAFGGMLGMVNSGLPERAKPAASAPVPALAPKPAPMAS